MSAVEGGVGSVRALGEARVGSVRALGEMRVRSEMRVSR